jgi:WD40 repeat protein
MAGIIDLSSTVQQMTLYLVDLSTTSTHVISTDLVRIRSVDWKPATDIVAISGVSVIVIEEYDRTQVWNTTTDTEIITFEEFSFGAVWSIDGQQLVTVDNQAITIRDTNWMPTSIIPIKQIVGGATIDLSPNDDLLVITEFENYTHNNIISVWNIATNQLISTRGSENIIDIMWSPDGTAFAILESDTIHIIDPLTGSTAATYLDDIDEVTAIAWDKANCRIAYAHVLKPEIVGQIDFINLSDYTDPNPSPQTGE